MAGCCSRFSVFSQGFFGCHLLPAIKGWLPKDIHLSCNWTFIKITQEALEVAGWMVVDACFATGKNPLIQLFFVIWVLSIAGLTSWKEDFFFLSAFVPLDPESLRGLLSKILHHSWRSARGKKIFVHAGCLWLVEDFLFRAVRLTGTQAATGSGKRCEEGHPYSHHALKGLVPAQNVSILAQCCPLIV